MAAIKKPDWLKKALKNAEDEEGFDAESTEDGDGVDDVLTVLNIEPETKAPETVKTSGQIGSASFRLSKPQGYFYDDVDTAFEEAINSLKWYEKALHRRDLDVHRLATEVDRKNTDYTNIQFQLEAYRAKGKVITGEDGKPIVVTGDATVKDYEELESRFNTLQASHSQLEVWVTQAQTYIKELEQKQPQSQPGAALPTPGTGSGDNEETAALRQRVSELEEQLAASSQAAPVPTPVAPSEDSAPLSETERQQMNAMYKWIEEAQVEFTSIEERVTELTEENGTLAAQVSTLSGENASLVSQLEALSQDNASLTAQVAEFSQAASGNTEQVEALMQENASLSSRIESLSRGSATTAGQVEALTQEKSTLSAQVNELSQTNATLSTQVEELSQANVTLSTQVEELSQANAQLSGEVERVTNENAGLQEQITAKDAFVEELNNWAEQVERQAQESIAAADAAMREAASASQATPAEQVYSPGDYEPTTALPQGDYQPTYDAPAEHEEYDSGEDFTPISSQSAPQSAVVEEYDYADEDVEEEETGDDFTRALNDINSPEVATDRRIRPSSGYKSAAPGSPLQSLPPGAKMEDYL